MGSLVASPSKDNINAPTDQLELRVGKLARSFRKNLFVEGDDLRHVGNRILRKSSKAGRQQEVSRSGFPSKVAGKWHADHRGNPAPIQSVSLNYDHRSSESRP